VLCQLAPKISAFYDVSVRRLADLPPASDRLSLAGLPLLLASGYRHSAPILSSIWTLVPPQRTFTSLVHAHAGRTQLVAAAESIWLVGVQGWLQPLNLVVHPQ
jgi:hypothetical protein